MSSRKISGVRAIAREKGIDLSSKEVSLVLEMARDLRGSQTQNPPIPFSWIESVSVILDELYGSEGRHDLQGLDWEELEDWEREEVQEIGRLGMESEET